MKAVVKGDLFSQGVNRALDSVGEDVRLACVFLEFKDGRLDITSSDNIRFACITVPLIEAPEGDITVAVSPLDAGVIHLFAEQYDKVTLHLEAAKFVGVAGDGPYDKLMVRALDREPLNWRPRLLVERPGRKRWLNADRLKDSLEQRGDEHIWLEVPDDPGQPLLMADSTNDPDVVTSRVWLMPLMQQDSDGD